MEARVTLKLAIRTYFCALSHVRRVGAIRSLNCHHTNTSHNSAQNRCSKHGIHSVRDTSSSRIRNIQIRQFQPKYIPGLKYIWLAPTPTPFLSRFCSAHKAAKCGSVYGIAQVLTLERVFFKLGFNRLCFTAFVESGVNVQVTQLCRLAEMSANTKNPSCLQLARPKNCLGSALF